jgi:hypothetical protein
MSEHNMRETDRWLRRFAIIGPIVAYMVGTMTGFVGAAWLFRDHEKRIIACENWERAHDIDDKMRFAETKSFEATVKSRLNIR